MKYKDNEISYKKAIKIVKRKKLPKKLKLNNIDTIYLDTYNYNNALLKDFNEKNIVIDISKLKIIDKDKTNDPECNRFYIQDTCASNICFLNELNLGGITYTSNSNDVTLRIHFRDFILCRIKEVNIVLPNGKVEKIELPFDTKDVNITSNRKNNKIIETVVDIHANSSNGVSFNKTYYIDEIIGLEKIEKSKYTKEDVINGVLDLTDFKNYINLSSDFLNLDTLIINKKDIFSSKFKNVFNRKLNIKTLKIIDNNDMKLNPVNEIEINDTLIIYEDYLINESKNKLIYSDKNKNIKVLDKNDLLNEENVEKVDFMFTNDIKLIIIKYKNNEFKVLDKDLEYNIDKLFNRFLLFNIHAYDFYDKEKIELKNYIKNNDYYEIFNESIIDNNLLFVIYKDYIEFIKYIKKLKEIGFTYEALSYLLKRKYDNIINPKSKNLIDVNKITQDEIDMFNILGEQEIIKKLKK